MHRHVIVALLFLFSLFAVACGVQPPMEDPPVVLPSATSSLPPAEPSPEPPTATAVPPTSTVAPPPSPTSEPTVAALPVERATPEVLDSARELTPALWSPEGRYLSYTVPLDATGLQRPDSPVGVKLLDATSKLICTVPTEGEPAAFLPHHLWLPGDRLLFRHTEGYMAIWNTPCEGEPDPVLGATPRFVRGVASSPDNSRWLTLSETDLWLFDSDSLQFQPVEGVSYGVHPAASWSPDGTRLVLVQQGRAYQIDLETGQATELATWESPPELGTENFPGTPPQWIDNQQFVVPAVLQGSPQLISLDGTHTDISAGLFGLPPAEGAVTQRAAFLLPGESEDWHLLLAEYVEGSGPAYQLYHSETQSSEQLDLPLEGGNFNFIDLVAGGRMLFNELGSSDSPTYWLRSFDPMGGEWTRLAEGSFRATVAPGGQQVAIGTAAGITVYGVDGRPIASWTLGAEGVWLLWSPSGTQLIATTLSEADQQLYLLELNQP